MQKPVLAVLAAGMGSRYGGLKQMDPMDEHGNLLVDFNIHDALKAGFEDVVFIIKRSIEADFRRIIGGRLEAQANVAYAFQELDMLPNGVAVPAGRAKPWGTTHAVLCARQQLGGRPFAIINADDYYGPGAFSLLSSFFAGGPGAGEHALVGYLVENTLTEHGSVSRGVCQVQGGMLAGITERSGLVRSGTGAAYPGEGGELVAVPAGTTVSMNCWGFSPGIMPQLEQIFCNGIASGIAQNPEKYEDLLPNAVQKAMGMGAAVRVLTTEDSWFGVTYQQDKPLVMQRIRELKAAGIYSETLW